MGVLVGITHGGFGRHAGVMKMENLNNLIVRAKVLYAFGWLTVYSNCFSRVTVLVLLYKIFVPGAARTRSIILIVYMVLFILAQTVTGTLRCRPISDLWNPKPVGTCIDFFLFFKTNGTCNIIGDLAAMILPAYTVWNLHASLARRAGIAFVFLSGSM